MTEQNLIYYPYASFTNAQLPLLKVAAVWFDKLVILDPVGASWDTVGADHIARDAVRQLKDAGILEVVTPASVLAKYEQPIAEAIRRNMGDREFLDLCDAYRQRSGKQRWTLSLAKVPKDVQTDRKMRYLMGDFARDVAGRTAYATEDYIEHVEALSSLPGNEQPTPYAVVERAKDYREYVETGQAYDEYCEGYDAYVEYRYADFPLALGEAIMMNHALFTRLLHSKATPLTVDEFHYKTLALKIKRAVNDPAFAELLEDPQRADQIRQDILAFRTVTDRQLELPISPDEPLEKILEHRETEGVALAEMRKELPWLARAISETPWTKAFDEEIHRHVIPTKIRPLLKECEKERNAWLKQTGAVLAAGAATAQLVLNPVPFLSIPMFVALMGLAGGTLIPAIDEFLKDRKEAEAGDKNGLNYLLRYKPVKP